jgi:hypothetical protein
LKRRCWTTWDNSRLRAWSGITSRQPIAKKSKTRRRSWADVEKQLADSEGGFLRRLDDLLKRNKNTETEFDKANQAERDRNARLEASRIELKAWLERERDRTALAERLPQSIRTFVEAFETLDPRQQKAHRQTILKAAHIYNGGRIELEFRE